MSIDTKNAASYFFEGQRLEKEGAYSQAANCYRRAIETHSSLASYHHRLGRVLQLANDYTAAIAAFEQAIALGKADSNTLICLGRCFLETQQAPQAAQVYLQMLALTGADGDKHRLLAHYQLGNALAQQGLHTQALISYQNALALNPKHTSTWAAQARSQAALGQGVAALHSLQVVTQLAPHNAQGYIALAQHCERSGPFSVAARAWEQVYTIDPNNTDWLLRYALALDMAGNRHKAEQAYRQLLALARGADPAPALIPLAQPVDLYCQALDLLQDNQYLEAQVLLEQAIGLMGEQAPTHWHYRLGTSLLRSGQAARAQTSLEQACRLRPANPYYTYALAQAIGSQGRTWQEAQTLQHTLALAQSPSNPGPHADFITQWQWELGEAEEKMNRFAQAAAAYQQANQAQQGNVLRHFKEGYAWERAGDSSQAAWAYQAAIAADQTLGAAQLGIGVFHQQGGFWFQAAQAYAAQLQHQPENAQLHYRLGLAYARCYEWKAARNSYCKSLALDIHQPECHYQLGFVYERLGMYPEAAQAYQEAVMRADKYESEWYYRLGYVLEQQGQHPLACAAFRQTRLLQRPHGLAETPLNNAQTRTMAVYLEFTETQPINENTILYESFNGTSITCNPLALFQALLTHPDYKDYLHVWVLNDKARIPQAYRALSNVVFVTKGSDGYLKYLATAKYLINNSGFPPYFIRREGQKYLATWHGTPLKTLGKEQKYKFYDHKRTQRNFLQASHIISPNPHTSAIQLDSYDIRPLYTGAYAETGYPRIDNTLNTTEEQKSALRQRMGLAADQPIVLYAPTWRGTLQDVAFDTERLKNDLTALAALDCQLIFRGHSLMENILQNQNIGCQVVPVDIDSNILLSIVDVLITDYSSIFFDFLVTKRPIIYYIYDEAEYEKERGLYFDMQTMPGIKCATIEELCAGVKEALKGDSSNAQHYQAARETYNLHDDGQATTRVIDFFFHDCMDYAMNFNHEEKPNVIFHPGGFEPNGITSSAINLITALDKKAFNLVLAIAPDSIEKSPLALEQFKKLPQDIYVVPRYGSIPMTLEERWVRQKIEAGYLENNSETDKILDTLFSREFKRIFGDKKYDAAISFSGYDAFFGSVLNRNKCGMNKLIYLHNDMHSEYQEKYPKLKNVFDLYQNANYLISVSEKTNQLNKDNLSNWPGVNGEQFVYCNNIIDPENIIKLAELPIEEGSDDFHFSENKKYFINIGRLSIEKDQEKLIRAFAKIHIQYPDTRLLILGDGPLRGQLDALLLELNLVDSVHMLGYRANPYYYLKRADCFILSSNHEGQPMTLLESLVLGKPIIATDIVGNRSVLQGRGGLLVENSENGLIQGMAQFLTQGIEPAPFDVHNYNQVALNSFYHYLGIKI